MSDFDEVTQLKLKVAALEYFVANLYSNLAVQSGYTLDQFKEVAAEYVEGATTQTFPNLHPAQSDMVAAEWRDAVEYMTKILTEMVAAKLAQK